MSVTERVMAAGSWDVTLNRDTPRRVLELIDIEVAGFAQLVVLPARLDPRQHSDATMLARARWSGIYRAQEGTKLSGAGAAILLGDEDGKGDVFETVRGTANGWLSQWVTALRPIALYAGTTYSPGGSYDRDFHLVNAKQALEDVCTAFDVEWRVNPALTFDVGGVDSLYGATPKVIILQDAGDGGRDVFLTGLRGGSRWARDLEDYTTKIVYVTQVTTTTDTEVVTEEGSPTYTWDADLGSDVVTDIGGSTTDTITESTTETVITTAATAEEDIPFSRPTGGPVVLDRLIEASEDTGSTPQAMADTQLGRFDQVRRQLIVDGGTYDLGHLAPVGSHVYLYAPPVVMDTTNPVVFRGRTCYPIKTRVLGCTWPITRGHGVYLRQHKSGAGQWIDLTDFVEFETGDVTLEVGSVPRPSS